MKKKILIGSLLVLTLLLLMPSIPAIQQKTVEDKAYNDFVEKLKGELGEDRLAELIETINIDKTDFADDLYTIIMSDDDLSERVNTLNDIISNEVTIPDDWDFPIISFFIMLIAILGDWVLVIFEGIFNFLEKNNFFILYFLILLIILPFVIVWFICVAIYIMFFHEFDYDG